MSTDLPTPATRVLAIASHVAYGYVGNTMAAFVLQALGCEVSAINTVNFSNHTGYRQFKGTRTTAQEIRDLYDGLKQSYLTDFDVLLSGYSPSAETVETVGFIARDLRYKATTKPGSFFWVLDPVMGDQGKLYVHESVVPAYKELLPHADLILPNQFEAETLSGVAINSLSTLKDAISTLHTQFRIPHIIVTSIHLPTEHSIPESTNSPTLTVVGSTALSNHCPRLFRITIPSLPCFFSGTGDMFAALLIARLREACAGAGLLGTASWMPDDTTPATELPLAKATEKVLASMQAVLEKTIEARDRELESMKQEFSGVTDVDGEEGNGTAGGEGQGEGKRMYLAETKAGEVRVVRNVRDLVEPDLRGGAYKALPLEVEEGK